MINERIDRDMAKTILHNFGLDTSSWCEEGGYAEYLLVNGAKVVYHANRDEFSLYGYAVNGKDVKEIKSKVSTLSWT